MSAGATRLLLEMQLDELETRLRTIRRKVRAAYNEGMAGAGILSELLSHDLPELLGEDESLDDEWMAESDVRCGICGQLVETGGPHICKEG